MTKHIIISITAIAATLGLSACGDVSSDDLVEALVDQGMEQETAECVTEYLEDNLSEDEFQAAAKADTADELTSETIEVLTEAAAECQAF